jgi:hypothetical protein
MYKTILLCAALLPLACGAARAQTETESVTLGAPAAGTRLASLRGGTDTTFNDMRLLGTTSNNTATDVRTGNNSISDGAFANMSGIPVVVQNTGANVLIQNALILNVQVR